MKSIIYFYNLFLLIYLICNASTERYFNPIEIFAKIENLENLQNEFIYGDYFSKDLSQNFKIISKTTLEIAQSSSENFCKIKHNSHLTLFNQFGNDSDLTKFKRILLNCPIMSKNPHIILMGTSNVNVPISFASNITLNSNVFLVDNIGGISEAYSIKNVNIIQRILDGKINKWKRRCDLKGIQIRATHKVFLDYPIAGTFKSNTTELEFDTGFIIHQFWNLRDSLNFTEKPIKHEGEYFGRFPNGTLHGTITKINSGEADLVIGDTEFIDFRVENSWFLHPYFIRSINAYFEQPPANTIRVVFFAPFKINLWLFLLGFWTLIFGFTFTIIKYGGEGDGVLTFVIGAFTMQGLQITPKSGPLRYLSFTILLFGTLLYITYSSSIIFILSKRTDPVVQFRDLFKQDFRIYTETGLPTIGLIIKNLIDSGEISTKLSGHIHANRVLSTAMTSRLAIISTNDVFSQIAQSSGVNSTIICSEFSQIPYLRGSGRLKAAMYVKRGSPLRDILNCKTLLAKERGLEQRGVLNYFKEAEISCLQRSDEFVDSLDLNDLFTAFLAPLGGIIISIDKGFRSLLQVTKSLNLDLSRSMERGIDYLRDPRKNKGLAFTWEERQMLGIHGLLPPGVKTAEEQAVLVKTNIGRFPDPLDKYAYLAELQERNERLFYRVLSENVEEYMPVVYTPTVGLACLKFGLIFTRPRGLFISIYDKGHVDQVIRSWPENGVRAVVVTDGERILGLGDLGAYGMGIPVGKLSLYTALAGVKPNQCLPVCFDVGTNNQELLDDPFYTGHRINRVTGEAYDDLIEEFFQAIVARYGQNTLIQFEDFANHNAFRLLEKYRNRFCTFNDDIQGTAAVALAGILASCRITKKELKDHRVLFLGAGEAALGIANLIVKAMVDGGGDLTEEASKIFMYDINGLLVNSRTDLSDMQKVFGKDLPPQMNFAEAVREVRPTILIGVSAVKGAFTKEIIQMMCEFAEIPVIFALSNPTSKAECTAEQAYTFSQGRAVFASGSPFDPFNYEGRLFVPGQGNNAYIFPGFALGVIAAGIHHVGNDLFLLAARTLANYVSDKDLATGRLFPPVNEIKNVSFLIAKAIVEYAYEKGTASTYPEPVDKGAYIQSQVYDFSYTRSTPVLYCTNDLQLPNDKE